MSLLSIFAPSSSTPPHSATTPSLPETIKFLIIPQRACNPRRKEALAARAIRQRTINAGAQANFLPETANIRSTDKKLAPLSGDLQDVAP